MAAVEAISTTYMEASGAEASYIVWDDIPSSYEHLEIRMSSQTLRASYGNDAVYMRLGDTGDSPVDTGSNYSYTTLETDGSTSPFGYAETGINVPRIARITSSVGGMANFGVSVIQILDYANANKNTTVLGFGGNVTSLGTTANSLSVQQSSLLWSSLTVVNAIHMMPADGTVWNRGSVFTLYGWNSS